MLLRAPLGAIRSHLYSHMSNGQNYLFEEMDTGHLGRPLSVLHKAFQT